MAAVAVRDLRNHTAEVLRRVEAGETLDVLEDNRPVARIVPFPRRREWIAAREILERLAALGPDSTGIPADLRDVLADTTDDLPW